MMDLTQLPTAFLVLDDALRPLSASRKGFSVFGIRVRRDDEVSDRLSDLAIAIEEAGFAEPLRAAAADLTRAGADIDFQWEREDRIYEVRASRLGDDAGIGVVIENVTQRVRHEETRETARRFLEDILNNVQLGVIVLNAEMRITTMNNAQERFLHRLGVFISWVESVGTPVSELLTDEAHAWDEITERVVERGETVEHPHARFQTDDGELVLSSAITPLKDGSGKVVGAIQVSEDVTERVRLEEELHAAEVVAGRLEAVRETAITVNHEINNPLTTILAIAQVLLMSPEKLDEKTLERLQTVEREVKRIAEVTQRLQTMDELKRGDYIPEGPKMIDIRE